MLDQSINRSCFGSTTYTYKIGISFPRSRSYNIRCWKLRPHETAPRDVVRCMRRRSRYYIACSKVQTKRLLVIFWVCATLLYEGLIDILPLAHSTDGIRRYGEGTIHETINNLPKDYQCICLHMWQPLMNLADLGFLCSQRRNVKSTLLPTNSCIAAQIQSDPIVRHSSGEPGLVSVFKMEVPIPRQF